jgi:hypothetical protein
MKVMTDFVAQDPRYIICINSTMAVKRGTASKSKSSFAFIWYLLAWFTFRTLPILYFKVTSNAEAVEQKKWGSKVRSFLSFRLPSLNRASRY